MACERLEERYTLCSWHSPHLQNPSSHSDSWSGRCRTEKLPGRQSNFGSLKYFHRRGTFKFFSCDARTWPLHYLFNHLSTFDNGYPAPISIIYSKWQYGFATPSNQEGSMPYQWTRYATVPLAILQSYATIALISRTGQGAGAIVSSMTNFELITAIISVTAGTVFLMWLGELISEKKIGNGASILIFAGIVTALPQAVIQAWSDLSTNPGALTEYIMFLAIALISIAAIVFITEGERTIPISYARQVIGSRIYGGSKTHLPLRVNPAGMIPIIFAVSIIVFPSFIAQFFLGAQSPFLVKTAQFIIDLLNPNHIFYGVFYFLLVVGFTYFYTAIIFQPAKIAENLQKQGGFVPGVRPGTETAGYLGGIMNKLLLAGSLFLGAIALLPILMQGTFGVNLVISGASMLIVVGVVIETIKQIDSQLMMRTYENQ